jgi:hypothetical protein
MSGNRRKLIIVYGAACAVPYVTYSFLYNHFPRRWVAIALLCLVILILGSASRFSSRTSRYWPRLKLNLQISGVTVLTFGIVVSIWFFALHSDSIDRATTRTSAILLSTGQMDSTGVANYQADIRAIVVRNILLIPFLYLGVQMIIASFLASLVRFKEAKN